MPSKKTGGAKSYPPRALYGWCGGEGLSLHENFGQSEAKGIVKDDRAPLSQRGVQCPTNRLRCRINVVLEDWLIELAAMKPAVLTKRVYNRRTIP